MKRDFKVGAFDLFILFNFFFLLAMAVFVYYKGEAEFFIYAGAFIFTGLFIWRRLRSYQIPFYVLTLLQLGIFAHFSGGLAKIDGARLYDQIFFMIRFDKYVHFYNAFAGSIALSELGRINQFKNRLNGARLIGAVFALGIFVELVELSAYLFLPKTGVGDIGNNVFDLVANILGATAGTLIMAVKIELLPGPPGKTVTIDKAGQEPDLLPGSHLLS